MLLDALNRTIDFWISELEHYSYEQLCIKPSEDSWSLGQVYMHLIEDTNIYIEQIKVCIATNDHHKETANPAAQTMFQVNDFPDMQIKGDPSNSPMPQPQSKKQLTNGLLKVKAEMNKAGSWISNSICKGKTKHPGLGYFNASEWLQFAEMHFRHHLRQKKRIDDFVHNLAL